MFILMGKEIKAILGAQTILIITYAMLLMDIFVYFSFHICCTLLHTKDGVADRFINDIKNNIKEIVQDSNAHTGGMVSSRQFLN